MHQSRIKSLNDKSVQNGEYILYWMQASQRVENNHALELAIKKANNFNQPLLVFFALTDDFPEANARHYYFMLEGLKKKKKKLKNRNIKMIVKNTTPDQGVKKLSKDASLVVTDRGYLKVEKEWKREAAQNISCPLLQVESDVVVPVEEASDKEEYAAYTLRKKINKKIDDYLNPVEENQIEISSLDLDFSSLNLDNLDQVVNELDLDQSVTKTSTFTGGNSEAKKHLQDFLANKLDKYEELSNDPTTDYLSNLGPYLHFGQISPLHIVLEAKKQEESDSLEDFLDQVIVRRELSINFVHYNQNYDGQLDEILSEWAYETLQEHKSDLREYNYSRQEFEAAKTHDSYWNAAQLEMMATGKMHGYMRMYWGKKILEWTDDPQTAYDIALYLNNKYSLDGRDPNSYAGIAWCFGKHDRAWQEREVFGKVRYMNANGLNRKFDADLYVNQVAKLCNKHNLDHNLPTGLL